MTRPLHTVGPSSFSFRATIVGVLLSHGAIGGAQDQSPAPRGTRAHEVGSPLAAIEYFARERIGEPRVIEVTDGVWVAVGFDLANVVLVQTKAGNVVIDAGSCTATAEAARKALSAYASGPVSALIYTHGDIEQTGGGGVWVRDENIPIWGTRQLKEQFFRQFLVLQQAARRRGVRQFGLHLPDDHRELSTLGRLPELSHHEGLPEIRLPTHTFDDETSVTVGEVEFRLIAAPGATPDHLFVWIPAKRVIITGDNFMRGFPEFPVMSASPRAQADRWIASLDRMRATAPRYLIAARHTPVCDKQEVQEALTVYRDAIQWVRDATVRGINEGLSVDELALEVRLPDHLAASPYLVQLTGCVEWAVRSIHSDYSGWFDDRATTLFTMPHKETSQREVELMGGPRVVYDAAVQACEQGDARWSVHLLTKLKACGAWNDGEPPILTAADLDAALAHALEALAQRTATSSGRAYLASEAAELRDPAESLEPWPCPSDEAIRQVPLETFFALMQLSLKVNGARDAHETVLIRITDEQREFVCTIRRGILEVVDGHALPETPPPAAVVATDGLTWRKLCMGVARPTVEFLAGRIKVGGSRQAARRFVGHFECVASFQRGDSSRQAMLTPRTAR